MPRESDPNAENQLDQDVRKSSNPPREAFPDDDDGARVPDRINPLVTKNASIKNK